MREREVVVGAGVEEKKKNRRKRARRDAEGCEGGMPVFCSGGTACEAPALGVNSAPGGERTAPDEAATAAAALSNTTGGRKKPRICSFLPPHYHHLPPSLHHCQGQC